MMKPINKQIFIVFMIIIAMTYFLYKPIDIKANQESFITLQKPNQVFEVEIGSKLNFDDIKTYVLEDDIKYVLHPTKLNQDSMLSELVIYEIDYSSFEVQEVKLDVIRYVESKTEKVQIDLISDIVSIQFIDETPPEVNLKKDSVTIVEGDKIDVDSYLMEVVDNSFDEVAIEINDDIDTTVPGKYAATYTATDKSGNSESKTLTVIVKEKPKPVIVERKTPVITSVTSNETQTLKTTSTVVNDIYSVRQGSAYYPGFITRYGYDCVGCRISAGDYSSTASGILVGADRVRQANGQWLSGYTYEGYHIVATSRAIPLFSILKISNHQFSGGGIVAGQPFYAIVGDRGVSGDTLDLFVGTQRNLNVISQSGSPRAGKTLVEVVRYGRYFKIK